MGSFSSFNYCPIGRYEIVSMEFDVQMLVYILSSR